MKKIITGLCAILLALPMTAQNKGKGTSKPTFLKYENVSAEDIIVPFTDSMVMMRRGDSVFTAKVSKDGIGEPVFAKDLTALKSEGSMTVAKNGNLYYSKDGDLYVSTRNSKGKWKSGKRVQVIGLTKDREHYEGSILAYGSWRYMPKEKIVIKNPSLSKDGRTLYFATNADSTRGTDIWTAQLNGDEEWAMPKKMGGGVNTDADEDFPYIVDGKMIVFTSNKNKKGDGENEVFVSRIGGKDEPTLYAEYLGVKEPEEPKEAEEVKVDTVAKPTEEIAMAQEEEVKRDESEDDGGYMTEKERLKKFLVADDKPSEAKKVSEKSLEDAFKANRDTIIRASKNVVATIDKRILYFDFDSDRQNGNFDEDIEVVREFINAYPNKSFLVVGHTDERGTYEYNDALSLKRAKKVVNVLAKMGVSRKRLFAQGFGEYKPVFMNAQTEEHHQRNRRVEIVIMD